MLRRRGEAGPAWLARLLGPGDPQLTSEECFAALDRYVELQVKGEAADRDVLGRRVPRLHARTPR
jgi:hypothetical protein